MLPLRSIQLDNDLRSTELGPLEYEEVDLQQYLGYVTRRFNTYSHHLGTTLMSAEPRSGVVDSDYKVHSVRNPYVSGRSAFPTSSHANPTLTVIALALRLPEHLISRFGRPVASCTKC